MTRFSFLSLPMLLALAACEGGSATPIYTDDVHGLATDQEESLDGVESEATTGETPDDTTTTSIVAPPDPIEECPTDACPVDGGVTWRCQTRFVYGTNMAWNNFGADFGGINREGWYQASISEDPTTVSGQIADMKAHGVNVIRWWMFPDFRGNGVTFDGNNATGITQQVNDDITTLLELAATHDVYLMLTLFSFDNFKPDYTPYMTPIALDASARSALVDNVVRPIAAHVEASDYAIRVHSWDIINEPEWAIVGPSLYGDPNYLTNDTGTDTISHGEMEQLLAEINVGLRAESTALISVGASMKWPNAWTGLDTDFHQLHYYPWMEPTFPLDTTPAALGLDDKPVVLGEFPSADTYSGESLYSYSEYVELVRRNGWAGVLGWDWNTNTATNKDDVLTYAEQNSCETAY